MGGLGLCVHGALLSRSARTIKSRAPLPPTPPLAGHPNFTFFQHDVIHPFFIEVDEIYHLACPASPPHYQYNPIKTIKTSTMGTLNMLGLAKRVKARLLFTSTSEIYGDPEVHPQVRGGGRGGWRGRLHSPFTPPRAPTASPPPLPSRPPPLQYEEYWGNVNTLGPRSCYDEGKRVAETMCYCYQTECGVQVRLARIFNTFGPRMDPDDGRVVSNFIIQALQGKAITIYGDGSQTRSFQYVSDLIQGLLSLMASDYSGPINIGNPEEWTVKQFAEYIQGRVNPDAKITYQPISKDDPKKRKPDITKARNILNWRPRVDAKDGLDKSIEYFKAELGMIDAKENPLIWMPAMADRLPAATSPGAPGTLSPRL